MAYKKEQKSRGKCNVAIFIMLCTVPQHRKFLLSILIMLCNMILCIISGRKKYGQYVIGENIYMLYTLQNIMQQNFFRLFPWHVIPIFACLCKYRENFDRLLFGTQIPAFWGITNLCVEKKNFEQKFSNFAKNANFTKIFALQCVENMSRHTRRILHQYLMLLQRYGSR